MFFKDILNNVLTHGIPGHCKWQPGWDANHCVRASQQNVLTTKLHSKKITLGNLFALKEICDCVKSRFNVESFIILSLYSMWSVTSYLG